MKRVPYYIEPKRDRNFESYQHLLLNRTLQKQSIKRTPSQLLLEKQEAVDAAREGLGGRLEGTFVVFRG